MYRNNYTKFWTHSLLLIISRCYDFITTKTYIPDISKETNILVKWFNIGYGGIAIIQVVLLLFVIYCFHFYCFKKYTVDKTNEKLTFKEFIPYFYFNKKEKWLSFLTKNTNKHPILYSIGYIATYSLIWIGFIVGTSTLTLILSNKYRTIYSFFGAQFLYLILIIVVIFFTYNFYTKEYRGLKNRNTYA